MDRLKLPKILRKRGLKHLVMETVDDTRWYGLLKRLIYRLLFLYWRKHLTGVLAIGQKITGLLQGE